MKKIVALLCLLIAITPIAQAQNTSQKLDELMAAYAKINEFNGTVLVAQQGKILLEKGYGLRNIPQQSFNDANTIYQTASITKTFTATLILKLAELKLLSINDKLTKFYPDYPHGDSITIENLLTHTSGIFNYTQNNDFMFSKASIPANEETMLALFKNKELDFKPGAGWNYSNSGYSLLGYIIEKATKLSYQQAIRHYIFKPLNMTHSGFDFAHLNSKEKAIGYYSDSGKEYTKSAPLVDSSVTLSAGSIYSMVGDLYKWHQGLLSNQIISKATQDKAYTPFKTITVMAGL